MKGASLSRPLQLAQMVKALQVNPLTNRKLHLIWGNLELIPFSQLREGLSIYYSKQNYEFELELRQVLLNSHPKKMLLEN